jgi:hypothetical protein
MISRARMAYADAMPYVHAIMRPKMGRNIMITLINMTGLLKVKYVPVILFVHAIVFVHVIPKAVLVHRVAHALPVDIGIPVK